MPDIVLQTGAKIPAYDVTEAWAMTVPGDGAEIHIRVRDRAPFCLAFASELRSAPIHDLIERLTDWLRSPQGDFDLEAEWREADTRAGL